MTALRCPRTVNWPGVGFRRVRTTWGFGSSGAAETATEAQPVSDPAPAVASRGRQSGFAINWRQAEATPAV